MRLSYKVQERQRIVGELEQNLTVSQELCDTLNREVSVYKKQFSVSVQFCTTSTCVHGRLKVVPIKL